MTYILTSIILFAVLATVWCLYGKFINRQTYDERDRILSLCFKEAGTPKCNEYMKVYDTWTYDEFYTLLFWHPLTSVDSWYQPMLDAVDKKYQPKPQLKIVKDKK